MYLMLKSCSEFKLVVTKQMATADLRETWHYKSNQIICWRVGQLVKINFLSNVEIWVKSDAELKRWEMFLFILDSSIRTWLTLSVRELEHSVGFSGKLWKHEEVWFSGFHSIQHLRGAFYFLLSASRVFSAPRVVFELGHGWFITFMYLCTSTLSKAPFNFII